MERGSTLRSDVCIVGAGAAGISIAQALIGSSVRVLLLESGGLTPDFETQRLAEGTVRGSGQPPLHTSRLRYFGGTTNHWVGWCGPLDELDFAQRSWVPDSGWPISRAALDPYYRRAHEVCDLGPFDYGPRTWGRLAAPLPRLAKLGARLDLVQHSAPTRFGAKYRAALDEADNVRVLLDSNLVEWLPDPELRTIERAQVATLAGNRFSVESRYFIMACGAVENARMLLASNRRASEGIGNARGLVGRYFMDHPRFRPAGVLLWIDERAAKIEQYTRVAGVRATLGLELTPELQERERLANNMFFVEGRQSDSDAAKRPEDLETARFLSRLGDPVRDAALSKWWIRCEQSPNPSSRVMLSEERDALGVRRPVLSWRLQDLDRHTLAQASRSYAQILTRARLARVKVASELLEAGDSLLAHVTGDWHQMGTTRMADGPERGVVDSTCRVFGLDNLFVAGASVFPTSGAMNPTLTLVALSLRLADHIGSLAQN